MTNNTEPDQLASLETKWSRSTICKDKVYPDSEEQWYNIFDKFRLNTFCTVQVSRVYAIFHILFLYAFC